MSTGIIAHIVKYDKASIEAKYALALAWGAVCKNSASPTGLYNKNTSHVGARLSAAMQRVRDEHENFMANVRFENERRSMRLNMDMIIDVNRGINRNRKKSNIVVFRRTK